jgi:hypothetical protein
MENSHGTAGLGTLVTDETIIYKVGDPITVARRSRRVVYAETLVSPAGPVFLRHTANGALTPGNFRTNADTDRAEEISNAKWISATTAAGLAVLEFYAI